MDKDATGHSVNEVVKSNVGRKTRNRSRWQDSVSFINVALFKGFFL